MHLYLYRIRAYYLSQTVCPFLMNKKISNVKTIIKKLKNKHYEKNLKTNILEITYVIMLNLAP